MTIDTARNLRLTPAVLVGGYVDQRKGQGALIMVRGEIEHLNVQQVQAMIAYLQACITQDAAA